MSVDSTVDKAWLTKYYLLPLLEINNVSFNSDLDFKKYSGHLPQTIMFQIEAEINLDSVQV